MDRANRVFFATCTLAINVGVVAACTMTPQVYPDAPSKDDADELAKRSAYPAGGDDGFVLPRATEVGATTPSAEPKDDSPEPDIESEVFSLTFGKQPPFFIHETGPLSPPHNAKATQVRLGGFQLQRTISVGEGYLEKATFTPDESGVLTLSTDSGTLYYFDVETGRRLNAIKLPDYERFEDADFVVLDELSERPQVVVVRENGNSVLDLLSGRFDPLDDIGPSNGAQRSRRFGLYGTSLRRTEPQSGSLAFFWLTGDLSMKLDCSERPEDWDLSADGKWLALSFYPSNETHLIDLAAKKVVGQFENPKWGGTLALSPDKSLLALGGDHLEVIRVADSETIFSDESYGNNISDLTFSPQGDILVSAAFDGKVRSYTISAQDQVSEKPQVLSHRGTSNVYSATLTKDGRAMVSSSGDQTLKIWKR